MKYTVFYVDFLCSDNEVYSYSICVPTSFEIPDANVIAKLQTIHELAHIKINSNDTMIYNPEDPDFCSILQIVGFEKYAINELQDLIEQPTTLH